MPHDSDAPPVQQDLNNKAGFAPRPAQGVVILLPTGTAVLAPGGDPDAGDLLSQIGGTFQNPFFVNLINTITAVVTGTVTTNQGAAGASPWLVAGTVTANQGAAGAAPWPVIGTKGVNLAAPGTTNLGTLPAQANAAPQVWTEGFQVPVSVDLAGNQRVIGTKTNNIAAPGANNFGTLPAVSTSSDPTYIEGNQVAISCDLNGYQRVRLLAITQWVSAVSAANAAQTVTLPAVAGVAHYIAAITIDRINASGAALAGSAALTYTTTNLPPITWSAGNALGAGAQIRDVDLQPVHPIRSNAVSTATTIVCPAGGAGVITRVNVGYYLHSI